MFIACFLLLIVLIDNPNYGQNHGMGLLLDDQRYWEIPKAVTLMRGDLLELPEKFSLKKFAPTPGSQGKESTCAGWSTGYAGRTMIEAIKTNVTDLHIDTNAFSPSFIYNQIRKSNTCKEGVSLIDALDVLKNEGALKLNKFGIDCSRKVTKSDLINASNYRILEYRRLTDRNSKNKVALVRKSISEFKPVVIAIDCPPSFHYAKETWIPDSSEYTSFGNGHAVVVVGYDDYKYDGAFEIINSWGTEWGNDGFMWIKYSDFQFFCYLALEILDKFMLSTEEIDLSGSLLFQEQNGKIMDTRFNGEYFEMNKPYKTGTKFELFISNNQPAYVYAFSSDLTYKTYQIFPQTDLISPLLPYKKNNIAIPDENSLNILDDTKGTSYYCFLYSNVPLDIENIRFDIENGVGNLWERLNKVLSSNIVEKKFIVTGDDDRIYFKAKSSGRNVVPILVAIKHI